MSLGSRLKEARNQKNLTQSDAAKRLGITFQALSNYERDARDPDTTLLKEMAELYEVSVDLLLGLTTSRTVSPIQRAHLSRSTPIPEEVLEIIESELKKAMDEVMEELRKKKKI